VSVAGRRAAGPTLSPDVPVGAAARATIAARVNVLRDELSAAHGGKIEGVHQTRVAIRRLRTTLELFAEALPQRTIESLERELAELGRAVGSVRDLDVLAQAIGKVGKKIDASLEPAVTTILRHVRDRRAAAHGVLVATLDGPRTQRLLERLDVLGRGRGAETPASGAVAADLVRPLVRELLRAGKKNRDDATPKRLHKLRIRAKRLRYALESLDGVGGKAARALAGRLAELQHVLGDQRDAMNQSAWLLAEAPAFVGDAEALVALGAVVEALRRRAERMAARVPRAWKRIDHPRRLAAVVDELARAAKGVAGAPARKAAA
jgi:CHAD domain-containing protein